MTKYPLIRTIYLYLFSLVGLTLLVIGGVRFVNMGLKAFIFTKADEQQRLMYKQPPPAIYSLDKINQVQQQPVNTGLTAEEKTNIEQWLSDYENWKAQNDAFDPIASQRQNEASMNLALILVGLPLFLAHWSLIKKDAKERKLTDHNS